MLLAAKFEWLAAEILDRSLLAYGLLLSVVEAGEAVDPSAASRITLGAGKKLDDLAADRRRLELIAEYQRSIESFSSIARRAAAVGMDELVEDCRSKISAGNRSIAGLQREIFGDFEAGETIGQSSLQ